MITTIIFDVGGVFVKGKSEDFFRKSAEFLDLDPEKNHIDKKVWDDLMRGTVSLRDFVRKVLGVTVPEGKVDDLLKIWFNNWTLDPEMVEFAKKLKKNYKMYVLSNVDGESNRKFGRHKMQLDFFDRVFLSFEIGMIKPDREIYEYVLKEINEEPENCVFIDDRPENIEGAEMVGIQGIVFGNKEQLKNELKKLGVKVD